MKTSEKALASSSAELGAPVAGCSEGSWNDGSKCGQEHGQHDRGDVDVLGAGVVGKQLSDEYLRADSRTQDAEPPQKPGAKAAGNQRQFGPARSQQRRENDETRRAETGGDAQES